MTGVGRCAYFWPVRKIAAAFFLFIMLTGMMAAFLEALPSPMNDGVAMGCCSAQACQAPDQSDEGEDSPCEGPCSPFMPCSTCVGVPIDQGHFVAAPIALEFSQGAEPVRDLLSICLSTVWQPPRA